MAVLITGGAGFIGVALARRFAEEGNEVLAFDYSPPKVDLADALPEAIRFEQGDIRDAELVKSMVEQSGQKDVIIHLAGILTAGCDQDPNTGMAINVGGMHHVLDAATAQGSRRVVLASTIGLLIYNTVTVYKNILLFHFRYPIHISFTYHCTNRKLV